MELQNVLTEEYDFIFYSSVNNAFIILEIMFLCTYILLYVLSSRINDFSTSNYFISHGNHRIELLRHEFIPFQYEINKQK